MKGKTMAEIIGVDYDISALPNDWLDSKDPNAVNYRVASARASNAIEGIVLSDEDKDFMEELHALDLSWEETCSRIFDYVKNKED